MPTLSMKMNAGTEAAFSSSASASSTSASSETRRASRHRRRRRRTATTTTATTTTTTTTSTTMMTSQWRSSLLPRVTGLPVEERSEETRVLHNWLLGVFEPVEKSSDLEVLQVALEEMHEVGSSNGIMMRRGRVDLRIGKKTRSRHVIIKLIDHDDAQRYNEPHKFATVLRLCKEIQAYGSVLRSMINFDEKRYPSALLSPPIARCFYSQLDGLNDSLVMEDLEANGYKRYEDDRISDFEHCKIVLWRLAHFHVIASIIQRDADMSLGELFPFAVDGTDFKRRFDRLADIVSHNLQAKSHTNDNNNNNDDNDDDDNTNTKEGRRGSDLAILLDSILDSSARLRAPDALDFRYRTLIHGRLDVRHILFKYYHDDDSNTNDNDDNEDDDCDEEHPVNAAFIDFSGCSVSSPLVDILYFLHHSVEPELVSTRLLDLLLTYQRSHAKTVATLCMHGHELEVSDMLLEFKRRRHVIVAECALKIALIVIAQSNSADNKRGNSNGNTKVNGSNGNRANGSNRVNGSESICDEDPSLFSDLEAGHDQVGCSLSLSRLSLPSDPRLLVPLRVIASSCGCGSCFVVGTRLRDTCDVVVDEMDSESMWESINKEVEERRRQRGHFFNDCTRSSGGLRRVLNGLVGLKKAHG